MIPRYFATWQPAPNHGPPQLNDTSRSGLEKPGTYGCPPGLDLSKNRLFQIKNTGQLGSG